MPKQVGIKGALDDVMQDIELKDFSGGLNSELSLKSLPLNASPDCQNVKFTAGAIVGRDGYIVRNPLLPANGDGIAFFYDFSGTRHLAVFANGNLYDMTFYGLTLVASNVYTAGNRICSAVLNSVLYFSDGETIGNDGAGDSGVRYYDPYVSTVSAPLLISSGSVGTIPTPACKCMIAHNGSLVLGNIKYTGGLRAKHGVTWTGVNDPTTIIGTNIFQVGAGQGGEINCLVRFGVASVGISPFQAIFVGKSEFGVYLLKGALTPSDLQETMINAPVGVMDGASAKFIPGPDGSGYIVWLASDRKVWYTNGVSSAELSKPINKELGAIIADRLASNMSAFRAVENIEDRHYVLDLGGDVQYCYSWDYKNWTRYKGWPSGYAIAAKDGASQDVLYCVDEYARLVQLSIGIDDAGEPINPYWVSTWIHAGDAEILKVWHKIILSFRTDTGEITVTATPNQGTGTPATATVAPEEYAEDSTLRWDVGNWDELQWGGSNVVSFAAYKRKKRLVVAAGDERFVLKGYDTQVKLSQNTPGARFEVMGLKLLFTQRGRKRVDANNT